jgi:hypothetical protein
METSTSHEADSLVLRIAEYALGHQISTPSDASVQLFSLVCHRDLLYYLTAVRAFMRASVLSCSVLIVSDGTLTRSDVSILRSVLPDACIRGAESDQFGGFPEGLPGLRRFVRENPLGRKLAGALRYASAPNLILLDSDVLFLRRPRVIVEWVYSSEACSLFGRDSRPDSCGLSLQSQRSLGVIIPSHFNSGLLCIRRASLDIALAEQVISHLYSIDAGSKWIWEQTAFAAMVGRGQHRSLPGDYLFVNDANLGNERDLTRLSAVHYSGPARRCFFTEGVEFLLRPRR